MKSGEWQWSQPCAHPTCHCGTSRLQVQNWQLSADMMHGVTLGVRLLTFWAVFVRDADEGCDQYLTMSIVVYAYGYTDDILRQFRGAAPSRD